MNNLVPIVFVPLDQRSENESLWEQPFQACAIDADCSEKLNGQNLVNSFVISKWLLPESLGIRSNKGLTLETSAFKSLYGGQFTLSTQLMKPNYLSFSDRWSRGTKTPGTRLVNERLDNMDSV